MKYIGDLITEARSIAKNEANPDGTYAIPQTDVVRFVNDAQDRLQLIFCSLKSNQRGFVAEQEITTTAGVEAYPIPDRLFMNKHIHQVQYSFSGISTDYVELPKRSLFNRDLNTSNFLSGYYIRNGKVCLIPLPSSSSSKIRVFFDRTIDDLALRSTNQVTNAVTKTVTCTAVGNDTQAVAGNYFSVVNEDGVVMLRNCLIASKTADTLVTVANLTTYLDAAYADLAAVLAAAGKWVVFGKYSTSHSSLPDECEGYLIRFAIESLLHKDSSTDVVKASQILQDMEEGLKKAYSAQTGEVQNVPERIRDEWY